MTTFQGAGIVKNLTIDPAVSYADLKIENGQLVSDNGLETAVLISLFTDQYIPREDLPAETEDPRGWWGDALLQEGDRIGSKLWIVLDRGKINTASKNLIKDFTETALQWLIDDGIAQSVEVRTLLVQNERIEIYVSITKPNGQNVPFQFLWDGQALKRKS